MKIILASKSPRRKMLLEQLGLEFEVIPSNANEDRIKESNPAELVKKLSKLKAETVAKEMGDAVVIGSDCVVFFNRKVIGKPKGETEEERIADGKRILSELSGKTHQVYSGVCVINTKTRQILTDFGVTQVKFRELSETDIERVVGNKIVLGGAGSYAPESWPRLFEKIDGSYTNVAGMPTEKLIPMLRQAGIEV